MTCRIDGRRLGALEHQLASIGGDPWPIVVDHERHDPGIAGAVDRDGGCAVSGRVVDQVRHQPFDLEPVGVDRRALCVARQRHRCVGRVGNDVANGVKEIHRLAPDLVRGHHRLSQLDDHVLNVANVVADRTGHRGRGGPVAEEPFERAGIQLDRGERRAEVVRHRCQHRRDVVVHLPVVVLRERSRSLPPQCSDERTSRHVDERARVQPVCFVELLRMTKAETEDADELLIELDRQSSPGLDRRRVRSEQRERCLRGGAVAEPDRATLPG